jgi:hypothetical protein
MDSRHKQIGMITTTDYDGGWAFILLRQWEDRIMIAVSQEHNGDAVVPLTVAECKVLIQLLQNGINLIEPGE